MSSQPLGFAAIIDEMKHEDPTRRLVAFRRLTTVAIAIREQRTREELVPYLLDCVDDDDEVLVAIAEELASFPDLVGGPAHVPCLLRPLEALASVDSKLVRDKAVTSLAVIYKVMRSRDREAYFRPMVERLAAGEWHNLRTSAVLLCPVMLTRVDGCPAEQVLTSIFAPLARDELPLVRRAVAHTIPEITPLLATPDLVTKHLLPIVRELANDDHESTRQANVAALAPVAATIAAPADVQTIAKIFVDACTDASWRVRNTCASEAGSVLEALLRLGAAPTANDRRAIGQRFAGLLGDVEPEVRAAAATALPRVAPLIREYVLSDVFEAAAALGQDRVEYVRAAVAPAVLDLAPVIGTENTAKHIYPFIKRILEDESADVRLALVGNLRALVSAGDIGAISETILPAVARLADDPHWRVRQGVIHVTPVLTVTLGIKAWDDRLGSLVTAWLGDAVHAVREAAVDVLVALADRLGSDWAVKSILPKVASLRDHTNYLHRMTALSATARLGPVLGPTPTAQQLVPIAVFLSRDAIPNVRFSAARVLGQLAGVVGTLAVANEEIRPALLALVDDADVDVKHFAKESLGKLTHA